MSIIYNIEEYKYLKIYMQSKRNKVRINGTYDYIQFESVKKDKYFYLYVHFTDVNLTPLRITISLHDFINIQKVRNSE